MSAIRVLFLGLGGIGQRHLRNLRTLRPDARIAAVRHSHRTFEITPDLRADHSVDIISKYNIALYPGIAEAIAEFGPDFAVVSSPSSEHARQTTELLRGKVPVLLEKPISADHRGLDDILRLIHEGRGPVMVGYMLRFHPGVRQLKNMLNSGILGRLYSVRIVAHTYMPSWHPYEAAKDFYAGRRDLGGGVILTNIHLIDLMCWLMGRPRRVWCLGGNLSSLGFNIEDSIASLFEYHIEGRTIPVSLHLSFVQRPLSNAITLHGERGELSWDLATGRVVFAEGESGQSTTHDFASFAWNDMFIAEMNHFLDVLAKKTKTELAFEDVLDGHLTALAMINSLEKGEPTLIPR